MVGKTIYSLLHYIETNPSVFVKQYISQIVIDTECHHCVNIITYHIIYSSTCNKKEKQIYIVTQAVAMER